METDYLHGLYGGMIIGLASTLMLFFNGRVTGISGILNQSLSFDVKNNFWRLSFVLGLILGGASLLWLYPQAFEIEIPRSTAQIIAAGFLVGFGTIMGSGCTSGHGVCGISRFSVRSLLATLSFIVAGIITTYILGALT